MNERIFELAKQAWKEILDETSIDGDISTTFSADEVVAFEQKFAELIVKKFDDILLLQQLDCIGNHDKQSAELIEQIRDKTKTYFGVEE